VRTVVFGARAAPDSAVETIAELTGSGVRAVPGRPQSVSQAIASGADLADEEVDSGADLLIVAVQGPDAGTPALALVAVLTNTEPVKVLPRGAEATAVEDWMRQALEVRDARRRGMPHRAQPAQLLEAIGGSDIATAAGFLLRAAGRRTPVLLDGLPAATAALVAYEAQPRAVRWWHSADLSPQPAHELALTKLGQRSILDLGIGLADATAGLIAVPVLRAAIRTLAALATSPGASAAAPP
jgi:nicotinate-nucleotide--dimethylbenzimidazole phosphoribosyltransferase